MRSSQANILHRQRHSDWPRLFLTKAAIADEFKSDRVVCSCTVFFDHVLYKHSNSELASSAIGSLDNLGCHTQ